MNVLFTSHSFYPDVGGIETHSAILARQFFEAGHQVKVVTQSHAGESRPCFDFEIVRAPDHRSLFGAFQWADVVYQNNIELGVLWPWFFQPKPLVVSLHTWIRSSAGDRRPVDRLKQQVLRAATHVVCVSEALRLDSYPSAVVIGNPYQSDLFTVLPGVSRSKSFVFVGRLVSDKGADLLIRAFSVVARRQALQQTARDAGYQLSLSIVGSGPEETGLRALARELGVADLVAFCGTQTAEKLVQILNQHHCLVVPSRWREPFGLVALEGAACGCCIIGSDGGGLPDAIGPTGLTFRRGDVDDLSLKMSEFVLDPHLSERFRAAAPGHLSAHTTEAVGARYLDVLSSALKP